MLTLVEKNLNGFDFYYQCAIGDTPALYNIVPTKSDPPGFGYFNIKTIESIRNVKFPERYQKPIPNF